MAVVTVAIEDLETWLIHQPDNTADTPYELNVTGLLNWRYIDPSISQSLPYILKRNSSKYVDLSKTVLPSVIGLYNTFENCITLTKAPAIPNSVIYLNNTFGFCVSLKDAPAIPNSVTSMEETFKDCRSLTEAPVIPNSVTYTDSAFSGCTSLTSWNQKDVPENITNYRRMFYNCTNLVNIISDRPYELKQWLTTIHEDSTDNFPNDPTDCTYRPFSEVVEVPFSNLYNELATWSANTQQTPYKLNVTELTASNIGTSGTVGTLGNVILSNGLKYVDLRHTDIPKGVTNLSYCFSSCTSLTTAPTIPDSVINMYYCFHNCTSLTTAPNIPNSVTNLSSCFGSCTSLTTAPTIPNSVTKLSSCFDHCTSLTTPPNIPNRVTNLSYCFSSCASLTTAPTIPNGVTNLDSCFNYCTSLTTVPNIPDSVTNLEMCFNGCRSLEEITLFEADLATLVTNNKAQHCFTGCTSLTRIVIDAPTPVEYNDWNIYRLKFDSNSVQGKVFHRDGTSHSITQTSITKSSLQLPILTDELWFPTESDSDIESIIAKMIQYKYGVFKKEVIPPDEKSFVLMADDPDKVKSNILPEVEYPIPESKGGTGQTSLANVTVGNATKATSAGKLTTARKTYVTLGTASTSTTRDWSGDTTIPVNGTLNVANGGTGMTTASYKNAVVVGNSSTVTNALRTIRTASGAFYATAQDGAPTFGTLPVGQGGTGATSLANITVGNSSKLGNISVQTSSIGGTTTETGNHWSYVTKAKFTSTSGYIVYSNGLIIQWLYDTTNTTSGCYLNFPIKFSNTNYACFAKSNTGNANESLQIHKVTVQKVWINRNNVASTGQSILGIGY